jgi:hypothetical protein
MQKVKYIVWKFQRRGTTSNIHRAPPILTDLSHGPVLVGDGDLELVLTFCQLQDGLGETGDNNDLKIFDFVVTADLAKIS